VKDFLWAELNRLDDDDDDDKEPSPRADAPAPSAGALRLRDLATEARVFARLTGQYNRFISHCMTMSRLKARNVRRGEEVRARRGGQTRPDPRPERRARRSLARSWVLDALLSF
jgi:hypothetical protein